MPYLMGTNGQQVFSRHWHLLTQSQNIYTQFGQDPANCFRLHPAVCNGDNQQTMNHVVDMGLSTKFQGSMQLLHDGEIDTPLALN